MQPSAGKERFVVLDGMRGVAALAVMLYHFTMGTDYAFFKNGYIAVDIFFILSGFVIVHAYGQRLLKGMSFLDFLCKRVARLYPMFLLGLLLGSLVFYHTNAAGYSDYSGFSVVGSFLINLFILPFPNRGHIFSHDGSVTGVIFPANNPLWSLFFEMMASMAFIWLVRLRTQSLLRLMGACLVMMVAEGLLLSHMQHQRALTVGLGWGGTANFLGGFPRVFYGFTCGVVLYRLRDRLTLGAGMFGHLPAFALYTLLCMALFVPVQAGGLYYFGIICTVAPALIALGASSRAGTGTLLAVSEFLGSVSYPLYCLHYPAGQFVHFLAERYYPGSADSGLCLAASCALTFALCIPAGLYYEPRGRAVAAMLLARLREKLIPLKTRLTA